jgi:type VI secretion system secreted protein Hcp
MHMKISRNFRRAAVGSLLGTTAFTFAPAAIPAAAQTFHVSIKGAKQGQFKSETTLDRRKDKWITGVSFSWGVKSPRDVATGNASGKRQYDPLCFVKEWGAASPQMLSAASTNEVLSEVLFQFTRTNANGEEYIFSTIKMSDATISHVRQFSTNAADAKASFGLHEEVCFTFRKVEVTNADAKTMYTDDWAAR